MEELCCLKWVRIQPQICKDNNKILKIRNELFEINYSFHSTTCNIWL